MGVLYARVAGAWVPISSEQVVPPLGKNWTIDPAYAGPWRTSGAGVDPNTAQFGNILGGLLKEGMHVDASGFVRFYSRAGVVAGGSQLQFHEVAADHVTTNWMASMISGRFQMGDICLGFQPNHGLWGLWIASSEGAGTYLMMRGPGGELYLNAGAGQGVSLRSNNVGILDINTVTCQASGKFWTGYNAPSLSWAEAHLVIVPSAGGQQARVGFQSPGIAPQVRSATPNGEKINIIDQTGGAWAAIQAAAFEVASTATIKRDVRTLRPERERVIVHHSVDADEVPEPDVMALRPVVFRPKNPMLRIVPTNGVSYDANDPESWRSEPDIGVIGHEGNRERLGLIAEDVETVLPSAVTHNRDGDTLAIDYVQITVALLDHVQELTRTVETLRYRLAELEGEHR